ncbi:hypothetical protein [Chryseolinea soli]|uniref:Uncharacterized protein n=1 Tax=Chryseolinea soli TaxID=2321403 RepID=A0A385SQJ1_9BACT|nr:hypothetical protein [Chryseolinea soli]AYB32517.1 hypothetical protein D4L85_18905 [Chryseolinea soli]
MKKEKTFGFKVSITRFAIDWNPGFVECRFTDAWGKEFIFVEKVPVVTLEYLTAQSDYPKDGVIACEVIDAWTDPQGRKLLTVDTEKPWYIETVDGLQQFDIEEKDLIEI